MSVGPAMRRTVVLFGITCGLFVPAVAGAAKFETLMVSRASGPTGVTGSAFSYDPVVNADGRFVAFASEAINLHPDDTDGTSDVYVRDMASQQLTLVSRATGAAGAKANGASGLATISADGRRVAFESKATNLSPRDTDDTVDVYVRDLDTNTTTLVSEALSPAQEPDGESLDPDISADGRFVAFHSDASNLDPVPSGATYEVFIRDLSGRTTQLVSRGGAGSQPGDSNSYAPAVSADGRFVAFASFATNLDPADTDPAEDVFVRDRSAGTTALISRAASSTGVSANGDARMPSISGDGRFVAFEADATNLDPADPDAVSDIFVRDVFAATTSLVSRGSTATGAKGNGPSAGAAVSADGRFVAFDSTATNLDPADSRNHQRVWVRDLTSQSLDLVSRLTGVKGVPAGGGRASVSGDGRYIAFASTWTNLAPGDENSIQDAFVRDVFAPAVSVAAIQPFGRRLVGGLGSPQTVTVTNVGRAPLTLGRVFVGGRLAPDFKAEADTCSTAVVPAGGTCTLALRFSPRGVGTRKATLNVEEVTDYLLAPDLKESSSVAITGAGAPRKLGLRCRAYRQSRRVVGVVCSLRQQAARIKAVLRRGGRVYASGSATLTTRRFKVRARRLIRPGVYRLTVTARDAARTTIRVRIR